MDFRAETFYRRKIEVNGHRFFGCHFRQCILIVQASMPAWKLANCRMEDCELLGDGWPMPIGAEDEKGRLTQQGRLH